jgi:hypothetical protein
MRKFWIGLLIIAPTCTTGHAAEEEVAATSKVPQPIAVSPGLAKAPRLSSPAVVLGRPRTVPVADDRPATIVPAGFVQLASPSVLPHVAAPVKPNSASLAQEPILLPETVAPPSGESASSFAIERAALFAVDADLPVVSPPEKLDFLPKRAVSAPPAVLREDAYAGESVGGDVFVNGHDQGGPPFRFYGSAEYLMWWTKDSPIPVLGTTGANTSVGEFGKLSGQTTQVLLDDKLDYGIQNGARLRLGYWLDTEGTFAVEGSFFALAHTSANAVFSSDSSTVLSRPFFNGNENFEDVQLVAAPGVSRGSLTVQAPTTFWGAELNLRCPLCCVSSCTLGHVRFDLLAGARFLRLSEGLHITEQGVNLPTAQVDPNQGFIIQDRFDTRNTFFGGQLGLVTEWQRGPLSVELRTTIALGNSHEVSNIAGSATFVNPDGTILQQPGGLFALPSNIGEQSKDRFAVVPEVGVTFGYQVTDWLKATIGYNFIYWSNVLRPGDQIDRTLDITQIPGGFAQNLGNGTFRDNTTGAIIQPLNPPRPVQLLKDTSFWAHGLTIGAEIRW